MTSFLGKKIRIPTQRYLSCLLLAAVTALMLQSCKKEYFELDRVRDDVVWNPEAAVPLINSTLDVQELLDRFDDEEIIVVDQTTGLLALRYFSEIFSVTAEDVLVLQNQSGTLPFPITAGDITTLTGNNPSSNSASLNYPFDLSNMTTTPELYTVDLDNGNLNITATSQVGYNADVTITIPGLTIGSNPYSRSFTVPANGTNTISDPLNGYTMDMTTGSQGFNELGVDIDVTWQPGGSSLPGEVINFGMSVNSLDFGFVTADLKQQDISTGRDSVRFRIFESTDEGDITWANPSFSAIFTNSYGANVSVNMQTFEVENTQQSLNVTSPFDNTVTISSNPTPLVPEITEVTMDNGNSNVVTVVNIEPDRLIYDADIVTNPGGGSNVNWMADTSRIRLEMDAILPFEGTASGFSISDTTEVDIFPLNDDIEEIVSITLRLAINNGFPVDGYAQVWFLDSNDVVIDSLFSNARTQVLTTGELVGSSINQADGKVQTITDITIDRDKLLFLETQGFRKMATKGWVDTTNMGQTVVRILREYTMDLFLGINIEARVNLGDL